jgi:Ulp1 family protease
VRNTLFFQILRRHTNLRIIKVISCWSSSAHHATPFRQILHIQRTSWTYIFSSDIKDSYVNLSRTIYVLDSLLSPEAPEIFQHVKRLIRDISVYWTTNDILSDIRCVVPRVPQQPNTYDCGVFVLHFARTFFSDPPLYCRLMEVSIFLLWDAQCLVDKAVIRSNSNTWTMKIFIPDGM